VKDRIKKLRVDNGLTQSQLAEIIGIKQVAMSMIEKGTNNPTIQQIELLSKYFNVSTDYLFFGTENIRPIERDMLKAIREDSGIYAALMRVLDSKKHLEGIAA
jgi:transcriptional regulator with XRE-family HTH domain